MSGSAFVPGAGSPGSIIPGFDPVDAPVYIPPGTVQPSIVTISTPRIAPPQQFTNVRTLINGLGNALKVLLFLNSRPIDIGPPAIPGGSLPGTSFPGFAPVFARYGRFLTEGQDYS